MPSFLDRLDEAKTQSAVAKRMAPSPARGAIPEHMRAGARKTCRRCKVTYVVADNTAAECRFHKGEYVCRYHPNGAAASGDGLGYYGNGPDGDGWAAKFWDCCGAEEPDAPGCASRPHASYDDDDGEWVPPSRA